VLRKNSECDKNVVSEDWTVLL